MANEVVTNLIATDAGLQDAVARANASTQQYAEESAEHLRQLDEAFKGLGLSAGDSASEVSEGMESAGNRIKQFAETAERAGGHTHGLYRAELAMAHGTELLGRAIGSQNAELGGTISSFGGTIQVVGIATHSFHGLKQVIDATRNSQILLNLVSGPVGWVALAGAAVGAALAWHHYATEAAEAAEKQKLLNTAAEQGRAINEQIRNAEEATGNKALDAEVEAKNYAADKVKAHEAEIAKLKEEKGHLEELKMEYENLHFWQERLLQITKSLKEVREEDRKAKQVAGLINRAQEAVDTHGMSQVERDRREAKEAGASPEQLQKLDELAATHAQQEADDKAAKSKEEYTKTVARLMERLKEETIAVQQGGQAKEEAAIRAMHLSAADEAAALAAARGLEAAKERKKADEEAARAAEQHNQSVTRMAASLAEKMTTPLERYQQQWKAIDEAVALHQQNVMQGIDAETAARARQAAEMEYEQAIHGGKTAGHAQVEDVAGSYNRIAAATASNVNPQKEIAEHTKATARHAERMEHHLEKIANRGAQPHSEHRHPKHGMES